MANTKSAKKRIKINKRNRLQNKFYKSSIRSLIKRFLKDLHIYKTLNSSEKKKKIEKTLSSIYQIIDKTVKCRVFHKNKAARKKARLYRSMKLYIN